VLCTGRLQSGWPAKNFSRPAKILSRPAKNFSRPAQNINQTAQNDAIPRKIKFIITI
jgi:hypothetical protein